MKNIALRIYRFSADKITYIISVAACIFLLWFAYGCEPKTKSILLPAQEVTRVELIGEIELLLAQYKSRSEDLNKQEELRDFILQQTVLVAQTGTVNPIGIATALLALLGIGAGVDDIRLRKQRAKQPYLNYVKDDTN